MCSNINKQPQRPTVRILTGCCATTASMPTTSPPASVATPSWSSSAFISKSWWAGSSFVCDLLRGANSAPKTASRYFLRLFCGSDATTDPALADHAVLYIQPSSQDVKTRFHQHGKRCLPDGARLHNTTCYPDFIPQLWYHFPLDIGTRTESWLWRSRRRGV